MSNITIYQGDSLTVLKTLLDQSVNMCVTSPPYFGLRNYNVEGQMGLELTPKEYINNMVKVFHEVKRVLRNDGTLWLNIGDTYSAGSANPSPKHVSDNVGNDRKPNNIGLPPKNLIGIPWRLAFPSGFS